MKKNVVEKSNGKSDLFMIIIHSIFFSLFLPMFRLRIELQDAETDDLINSTDITKDSRRRQRLFLFSNV